MKSATISELKNQLSKFLRYVKHGEVVVVLERGVPVAEIQPRSKKGEGADERLDRLEAKGIVRRGNSKWIQGFPFPSKGTPSGVLDALLEERRSGR